MLALDHPRRLFYRILVLSFAIKLLLAWWFPVTGDEAYFVLWGKYPDYGYYDHPAMLGWWLAPLVQLSDALWWLRLPSVLVTSFVGWALFRLLRDVDADKAAIAGILFLIAPVTVIGVPIANDIPLMFWSLLSAAAFYRAQRDDGPGWYLLAGVLLGLAFLSKFFAGALGIAFAAYVVLFARRGVKPWLGLLLVVAGTIPGVLVNLLWNYNHCWDNYLFNLFNRTRGHGFSISGAGNYILVVVYLATPPIIYYVVTRYRQLVSVVRTERVGVFAVLVAVPAVLLLILSLRQPIGIHWLLSFYPFLFAVLPFVLGARQLQVSFIFLLSFTAIHVLVAAALPLVPTATFRAWTEPHQFIVFGVHTGKVAQAMEPYARDSVLATDNYTLSATLEYRTGRRVIVFGAGSRHGRQDDILTDFRELDGGNILILRNSLGDPLVYTRYFNSLAFHTITVEGARYYLVDGKGFRYEAYRDDVLRRVRDSFYRIPAWLPTGACYMNERYFSEAPRG